VKFDEVEASDTGFVFADERLRLAESFSELVLAQAGVESGSA
jgi:hypothetical protein